MLTDIQSPSGGLPHAVFLQRVTEEPVTSPQVRLGQGAFLALRFVDLLAPDREPATPEVFRYQWAATERFCAELASEADGTEAAHLYGIVRATGEARRTNDIRLLAPSLLAYALYLEQSSRLSEAEDVVRTLIHVAGDRLSHTDCVSAWMRLGRVRRLQADFDRADIAYAEAGRVAGAAGDRHSELMSRMGHVMVQYYRGNLSEAERGWRSALADAAAGGFKVEQAQAEHGLGNVLQRRGLAHDGAPHLWRAYELYEDGLWQLRALGDLGVALLSIGEVTAAERALEEVVRRGGPREIVANALIELMHCASFRRDRMAFERYRERALPQLDDALPNIRADYHLKVGIGLGRFGNMGKAEMHLRQALDIATVHALHEMAFRVDRIVNGLRDCNILEDCTEDSAEPVVSSDALREVSASLAAFS
jgi:tetratricopeptide (TPR) repeat protein